MKVCVTYSYPNGAERSAEVDAPTEERAAVRALLEGELPAYFDRGRAIFWCTAMAGEERWPVLVDKEVLAWGDPDNTRSVVFSVIALETDEP